MPKKSKKLNETEFTCLCCRKTVEAETGSICVDLYRNGKYALRGTCVEKKCKLSKIISNDDAKTLMKKYGDCPANDSSSNDSSSNKAVEAGGILALFALLGGAIFYAVKSGKN